MQAFQVRAACLRIGFDESDPNLFIFPHRLCRINCSPISSNQAAISAAFDSYRPDRVAEDAQLGLKDRIETAMPVALTRSKSPPVPESPQLRLRWLVALSPVGVTGAFTVGLTNGAFWTIGPVYANLQGLGAGAGALRERDGEHLDQDAVDVVFRLLFGQAEKPAEGEDPAGPLIFPCAVVQGIGANTVAEGCRRDLVMFVDQGHGLGKQQGVVVAETADEVLERHFLLRKKAAA